MQEHDKNKRRRQKALVKLLDLPSEVRGEIVGHLHDWWVAQDWENFAQPIFYKEDMYIVNDALDAIYPERHEEESIDARR